MRGGGLYAITDSALLADGKLLPYVEAALIGGARWLQYRDKSGDSVKRLEQASQLRDLCRQYGCELIINDDLALAAELGVGLHLGQEDGSLREARQQLGPQALLGATCHASLQLAEDAIDAGADHIAFGRFYTSQTKPGGPSADLPLLRAARALQPADRRHRRHHAGQRCAAIASRCQLPRRHQRPVRRPRH